jgi:hypothetical protein
MCEKKILTPFQHFKKNNLGITISYEGWKEAWHYEMIYSHVYEHDLNEAVLLSSVLIILTVGGTAIPAA